MHSDDAQAPRRDGPVVPCLPLRVGVILRGAGTVFPEWQARCLRRLLGVGGVEIALLVVDERTPDSGVSTGCRGFAPRIGGLLWALYGSRWVDRRSRAMRPVRRTEVLVGVPEMRLHDGGPEAASAPIEGLDAIRAVNLDIVLDFGGRLLSDDLTGLARYGVWSFGFGEPSEAGDDHAGLWAVYRGDSVTRAALKRLPEHGAPGATLYDGYFKTIRYSFPRHRDAVLRGVADWPARACRRILAGVPLLSGPVVTPPSPRVAQHAIPTTPQMIRLLGVTAWRFARTASAALLYTDEWNIGIAEAPIDRFLDPGAPPQIRWLPQASAGSFLADPFGTVQGSTDVVLVEEFEYRTGKGRIAAIAVEPGTTLTPPAPVIEASVHLSYPYLIAHAGQTYCVPEMHQAGEVRLYRATAFPREWVRCATLIEGFAAADATVFRHEGRWWLLCSEEEHHPNTTLHAWYADDLHGPWTAHATNPVKTDVRSSRPAGTPFVHDGCLYRPAQDCSKTYGGAVVINQVRKLTPTEFEEEPVANVDPDRHGPYPHGLHTLSAWGQRTLIDGKRRRFMPGASWRRVRTIGTRLTARGRDRLEWSPRAR